MYSTVSWNLLVASCHKNCGLGKLSTILEMKICAGIFPFGAFTRDFSEWGNALTMRCIT
jgi:hypothetical protein